MSNNEKLRELKIRYLHMEHPHWTKEQWHKKIDDIFIEKNSALQKFSVEEAIIRNLEFCYNAPEKRIRVNWDRIAYLPEGKEKTELRNKLEKHEKERWNLIRKRTRERLEWYNSL